MTYLLDGTNSQALMPGGLAPAEDSLREALARAEEARSDERAKRMAAESVAQQMAELIAQEHRQLKHERAARERAERMARELADLVTLNQQRAEAAEEHARQAFCAYLDDPFRAPEPADSRRSKKILSKLRA